MATKQKNLEEEGLVQIPVTRNADFVRLAPNNFSAWHVPGDGGGETRFAVYLQFIENRETNHYLRRATDAEPQATILKKDVLLEVTELAAMSLTLLQMKALKEAIDGALARHEQHQARKVTI
jgi:hypothetical protein